MKSLKVEGPGYDSRFAVSNVKSDRITLTPGPIMFTGSKMDIAMNNSTVLGVTAANGDLAFTRRGDLRVNDAFSRPRGIAPGDVMQECFEKSLAVFGMQHLRMELHSSKTAGRVFESSDTGTR
jgi:flagellar basal body rod protein FlgF